MTRVCTLGLALVLGIQGLASAREALLVRYPDYHNGKVAFAYLGDIWTANEDGTNLQRLTVNKARDIYPRFSPDGNSIAFSSIPSWNSLRSALTPSPVSPRPYSIPVSFARRLPGSSW